MTIYEKLLKIQSELHAPKGQYNNFGKYKYRSCEDILEAVKPLNAKYGLCLILSDEIVSIGARYYVKATALIIDTEVDVKVDKTNEDIIGGIRCEAYAREEDTKKGMDGSQITGASSSYARKYALNGLYNIDDTKDSDATNTHGKSEAINFRTKLIEELKARNVDIDAFAKANHLDRKTTQEEYKKIWEGLKNG